MRTYRIQELLFPEIENFDPDEAGNYPFSVADLITHEKRATQQRITSKIQTELFDPAAKKCQKFREPKKDKRARQAKETSELAQWHGFKKRDLELKDEQELEAIQLRKMLDARKTMSKGEIGNKNYTAIGTIIDDPLGGKSGRLAKSQRRERLIDELQSIDAQNDFSKRKFQEIQQQKMKTGKSQKWKKLKRIQKKKAHFAAKNKAT